MTEELTKFRREVLGIARRNASAGAAQAITAPFIFFASSDSDYVSGQLPRLAAFNRLCLVTTG